ncbi:XRE family transcriptional regulator [Streptomyces tsukubensis]|uniref:Transcriptional regulator n=1 Tax=Streptomyces tsukubensis TaxID=83656 RepID=A0A1V4AHG8_9ACTN|nr:transcriptional regulator [Streptomyces tsukubensis]QFR97427.1 XRE family transcriptional regulator [Streptomyces tsukubensis]
MLHRTIGTYHRLECGSMPTPPVDLLHDVARLFALNEQEWISLFRYARQQDPPHPLHLTSGKEVPGVWQEAVDGIGHMAYVTDASWDLLAANDAFTEMFPEGRLPRNTLRWMLLEPEGRKTLTDWPTAWAIPVLSQLKAALASRPDDEILRQIEKEVLADPATSHLYEEGGAYIHPDGDERPLLHAIRGAGWVNMCAAQPLSAPGARLIILVFKPGQRRAHARTGLLRVR